MSPFMMLWAEKALREHPNYYPALRVLAASNALAGRLEEAQKTMARLRAVHPTLRVSDLRGLRPLRRQEVFATYSEGLGKARLPGGPTRLPGPATRSNELAAAWLL